MNYSIFSSFDAAYAELLGKSLRRACQKSADDHHDHDTNNNYYCSTEKQQPPKQLPQYYICGGVPFEYAAVVMFLKGLEWGGS
ncbi:hypothetical protein BUALT_Bualt10G0002300 [Buddleja alternifolia]|uniref:Uncharacterized protein n=1 Tax=Buddleja alternifolia TaxID=168488 RepID=A0AAV6WZQ5_9LAMI|nr:hypothetical protein BUALT_Bualt10G0002300 [Buddleja alternifolia]